MHESTHNLFSIGNVAKMFHVSVSTLRHYENIGILTPEYTDPDTGYRYYSAGQFEVLNTVRYLRALDMPLSEIADFLNNREIESIEGKLKEQKENVIRRQEELKRIEKKIDHRLERLREARECETGKIEVVTLPECRMVRAEESLRIHEFTDMETPIRRLEKSGEEGVVFLGKVGLSISKNHLEQKNYEQYDGIFIILDEEDHFEGEILEVPEITCVRVRFRGSHAEAPEYYEKLCTYILEHRLKITGFSREITLIDYGITSDMDKFVTEICIPVTTG